MTALSEGKKAERRVRITLEGRVMRETDAAFYVDTGATTHRIRKVGVEIEELATPYDWRDGDVVQVESRHSATFVLTRDSQRGEPVLGEWFNSPGNGKWTDKSVADLVDGRFADSYPIVRVLRYQAGGVGS